MTDVFSLVMPKSTHVFIGILHIIPITKWIIHMKLSNKRKLIKSIVLILGITTLSISFLSCHRTPSFIIPNDFQGILSVKEWKVTGPFEFDTLTQNPLNTYYNKDLEKYGVDEELFSESDFETLKDCKIKSFSIQCYNSPVKLFDHIGSGPKNNKSNFYLYTSLYSES